MCIRDRGGNDFLQRQPPSETEASLRAILSLAKTQRVPTVLLAIPELSPIRAAVGNLSDHPLYENIAEETATPLVAEIFSEVLSDQALKSDQVHPNAEGYRVVHREMVEAFKQLGYAR